MSNLVVNGGFEAGIAPWIVGGLPTPVIDPGVFYPTSPTNSLAMDNIAIAGLGQSAAQSVSGFIIGEQYVLQYGLLAAGVGVANIFSASIDATVVSSINLVSISGGGWSLQTTAPFIATATSMTLTFNRALSVGVAFSVNLDAVSIVPAALICFSGNSKVLTKNIQTEEIREIIASRVYPSKHQIFSPTANAFIPLIHNVIGGITKRYTKIAKGSLGENEPHTDFFVTSGHRIQVGEEVMKAKYAPGAKTVKVHQEYVFTFVTEIEDVVLINGMKVKTWSLDGWKEYADRKQIEWRFIEQ